VLVCATGASSALRADGSAPILLQDGLEALSDQQPTEARSIFNSIYPRTPEAARAARELRSLDGADDDGTADQDGSNEAPLAPTQSAVSNVEANAQSSATRRAQRAFVMAVGDRVFFAESSFSLGGRARSMLENQSRWLAAHPGLNILVIGRADDGGSAAEARELSLQRAEVVRAKLVEAGVPAPSITIDGRGNSDPVATCHAPLCQAQNRLAETLISVPQGWRSQSAVPDDETDVPAGQGTAVSAQGRDGPLAR
jgi:peptidoglycan-associated lipoprotein